MKILTLALAIVCVLIFGILSLTAEQGAPRVTLQIAIKGQGTGTVVSSPTGIQCVASADSGCTFEFSPGTPIVLTAQPAAASEFAGWSGVTGSTSPCVGQTEDCRFTLTENSSAVANFSVVTQQQMMPKSQSSKK
jgi:Divergent InlB B-repeat domain